MGAGPSLAPFVLEELKYQLATALPLSLQRFLKENTVCMRTRKTFIFLLKEDGLVDTVMASSYWAPTLGQALCDALRLKA